MNCLLRTSPWIALVAVGLVSLAGCGESLPETVEVHGQITYQGEPLETGMVTFEPVKTDTNPPIRPAKGFLESDGTYRLSTFRTNDGAMPGEYVVLVHAFNEVSSVDALSPAPISIIPEKYNRSDTSSLTATIPANGNSSLEMNFDLTP